MGTYQENNRNSFYSKIDKQEDVVGSGKYLFSLSGQPKVQLSYTTWVSTLFKDLETTKKTLAKLQAAGAKEGNWVDRLIPTHKAFFGDEQKFIKTYACDLEWAKTLEYCKTSADSGNQQQGTLDEYVGFYTGKDDEGKDHRQEIKISGTNLVTSTKHKVAGDLTIILTPTGTKDIFSVDIQNTYVKSSSGTATFTRNKDGKVCSITSSAKVKPVIGKEQSIDATATKEGVSCDGATPSPVTQTGGQQGGNQIQTQYGGDFPPCIANYGGAKAFYILTDNSNKKVFGFSLDEAGANKIKTDNPNKQLDISLEDCRFMRVTEDYEEMFNRNSEAPRNKYLIFRKDGSFISNSSVKRGKYICTENGTRTRLIDRESVINEQTLRKKIRAKLLKLIK
jgi:hypothetical protein